MGFLNVTVNVTQTLHLTSQDRLNAIDNLQFVLPTLDVPTLLNNSKFIGTLGCHQDSKNISCIDVCGNVEHVFANWPNFYTCTWLPRISKTLAAKSGDLSSLTSLGFLEMTGSQESFSSDVSSTVANCLADYCQSSNECQKLDWARSCAFENLLTGYGSLKTLNRSSTINCLKYSVCGSTTNVNPDIGGLGVLLALLIQYSISLLAVIMHLLFVSWYLISFQLARRNRDSRCLQGEGVEEKATLNRRLEALTSGLVEFQKAQCFFSATLQIASLIVLPSYIDMEDTRNSILLRLTSANAFAPIMLSLTHISFLGDRNSGYLLLLSIIAFMLGTATYWETQPFSSGTNISSFYTPPTVPVLSCKNIAPFAPCYLDNEFYRFGLWSKDTGIFYSLPQKTGIVVWVISFWILCCRLLGAALKAEYLKAGFREIEYAISRTAHALSTKLSAFKLVQRLLLYWGRIPGASRVESAAQILFRNLKQEAFWNYSQLSLGILGLLMQVVSMLQVLSMSSNIISMQMSFGQIVAVGIWVPVLLEYAYLAIRGVESGTKYRLKSPLLVIRDKEPSTT